MTTSGRALLLWGSLAALILIESCSQASTVAEPAGSSSPPYYAGPVYRGIGSYQASGVPYDFLHGLSEDQAAIAVRVAEGHVETSGSLEVGFIARTSNDSSCPGDCGLVTLIDQARGETYSVIVDLTHQKVLESSTQTTVEAALGEDAIRRLYGIALADPEVSAVVGPDVAVSPDVSPITTSTGSCSPDSAPPHRCAYGVVYFPRGDAYVYVDLTGGKLVNWSWDKDEG